MTKKCTHCGEEKKLEFFHRHPTASLGRKHMCKACANAYGKHRHAAIQAAKGKVPQIKVGGFVDACSHKKGDVRGDGLVFWAKRKYKNGFQEWWMTREKFEARAEAVRERMRWRWRNDPLFRENERAQNQSEVARARKRSWNKRNRPYMDNYFSARRAKLRGQMAILSDEEKKRVKQIYQFRDALNRVHQMAVFHVDHKKPIARGGLHHPDNLQVTTADYNVRKFVNDKPL